MPRRDLGETGERALQDFELFGRRAFLRTEGAGRALRTEERIIHVAGGRDRRQRELVRRFDSQEIEQLVDRPGQLAVVLAEEAKTERAGEAEAAVVRRAPAEADDDLARAAGNGGAEHFADAKSRGAERIAFVRRELGQAGRGAHFADGEPGFRQPGVAGRDLAPERVVRATFDPFAAGRAADRLGCAFATVGQGDNLALGVRAGRFSGRPRCCARPLPRLTSL